MKRDKFMPGRPLITVRCGAARVRDRIVLPDVSWEITAGQNWTVLGPNGSGKSTLMKVLTGDVPLVGGEIIHHPPVTEESIGHVSFEKHEELIAEDELADHARDFAGDEGFLVVRDVLTACPDEINKTDKTWGRYGVSRLLERPLRSLSTGEIRKVLIARELARKPPVLVLDEPFGGLDARSSRNLAARLEVLMRKGLHLILVTNRRDEILPGITHLLLIRDGRIMFQGEKDAAFRHRGWKDISRPGKIRQSAVIPVIRRKAKPGADRSRPQAVIDIRNATVIYNGVTVLDRLNWTVRPGENWAVTGPNGSGKSTLLALIAGDHPQAYANEIYLFGRRRGSGESIWDIKKRIGFVSSEFQVRYRKPLSAFAVAASGFFDSVGLYREIDSGKRRRVRDLFELFGIKEIAGSMFNRLSYGERRMVLLARAMVKCPELLLLDEPCQGLDERNRRLIMDIVEFIGTRTETRLIYVTHRRDEIPACIDRELKLGTKNEDGKMRSWEVAICKAGIGDCL